MAYEVTFAAPTRKDLRRLTPELLDRVLRAVRALANDPRPTGSLKLVGSSTNAYRIRVGDYRIVYEIADAFQQVLIRAVRHRREAYRS